MIKLFNPITMNKLNPTVGDWVPPVVDPYYSEGHYKYQFPPLGTVDAHTHLNSNAHAPREDRHPPKHHSKDQRKQHHSKDQRKQFQPKQHPKQQPKQHPKHPNQSQSKHQPKQHPNTSQPRQPPQPTQPDDESIVDSYVPIPVYNDNFVQELQKLIQCNGLVELSDEELQYLLDVLFEVLSEQYVVAMSVSEQLTAELAEVSDHLFMVCKKNLGFIYFTGILCWCPDILRTYFKYQSFDEILLKQDGTNGEINSFVQMSIEDSAIVSWTLFHKQWNESRKLHITRVNTCEIFLEKVGSLELLIDARSLGFKDSRLEHGIRQIQRLWRLYRKNLNINRRNTVNLLRELDKLYPITKRMRKLGIRATKEDEIDPELYHIGADGIHKWCKISAIHSARTEIEAYMEPKINSSDLSIRIMTECNYVWNELSARNNAIIDCMKTLFEMEEGFMKLSNIQTSFDTFKTKFHWDNRFITSMKFYTYRADFQLPMMERIKYFRHVSYKKLVRMMRIVPWYLSDWGKTLIDFFTKVDLNKCPTSELRFWFINMVGHTCEELAERYSDSYSIAAEQLRLFGCGHTVFPAYLPRPKPFHPCLELIDGCEQNGKIYENLPGFVYRYADKLTPVTTRSQAESDPTKLSHEIDDSISSTVDPMERLKMKGELHVSKNNGLTQIEERNIDNIPDDQRIPISAWIRSEVIKPRLPSRPTMTLSDNKRLHRTAVTNSLVKNNIRIKAESIHDKLGRNTAVIPCVDRTHNRILTMNRSHRSIVTSSIVDLVRHHLLMLQESYRSKSIDTESHFSASVLKHNIPNYRYFIVPTSHTV